VKYKVVQTAKFKRTLRQSAKRGLNVSQLEDIVRKLSNGETLPPNNYDHSLQGNYNGCRECHIKGDWLLVYKIYKDDLILELISTGTHSDLF
jgi:mRNA interferase YafQ